MTNYPLKISRIKQTAWVKGKIAIIQAEIPIVENNLNNLRYELFKLSNLLVNIENEEGNEK